MAAAIADPAAARIHSNGRKMADASIPSSASLVDDKEDLEGLLQEGLKHLLLEASRKNAMVPPFYGRPDPKIYRIPFPQEPCAPVKDEEPLLLDDDGEGEEGDDVEEDEEDESEDDVEEEEEGDEEPTFKAPPFKFDYGFNPLGFLGKFLHQNHPRNIAKTIQAQREAFQYLRKRAEHGKKQVETAAALQHILTELSSGIALGPMAGSVTTTTAILWTRASKPGRLRFEYSDDLDFSEVERSEIEVTTDSDLTGRVFIKGLDDDKVYYIRVCLINPTLGFPAPPQALWKKGKVRTLPEFSRADYALRFAFGSHTVFPETAQTSPPHLSHYLMEQFEAQTLNFMLLLGDTVPPASPPGLAAGRWMPEGDVLQSLQDLRRWYRQEYSLGKIYRRLADVPIMAAWNDSSEGSAEALQQEEDPAAAQQAKEAAAEKKALGTGRGTARSASSSSARAAVAATTTTTSRAAAGAVSNNTLKSPTATAAIKTLPPLPLRPTFQAFSEYFPLRGPEVRGHSYWKFKVNGDLVELYFLDTRNGKIGLRQANWLMEALQASTSTWKIIANGSSIGYTKVPPIPLIVGEDETSVTSTSRSGTAAKSPASSRSNVRSPSTSIARSGILPSPPQSPANAGTTNRSPATSPAGGGAPLSSRSRTTRSARSSSNSDSTIAAVPEQRVFSMAQMTTKMQQQGIKNVLFLSGGVPFPYIVSIEPESTSSLLPSEETQQQQARKRTSAAGTMTSSPLKATMKPSSNTVVSPTATSTTTKKKAAKSSSGGASSSSSSSPLQVLPTYYEFGAASLLACDNGVETKHMAHKLIIPEESISIKEVVPLMVGSYYGLVTISKHGRIKYSVYSTKDGNKKQWLEIKPTK